MTKMAGKKPVHCKMTSVRRKSIAVARDKKAMMMHERAVGTKMIRRMFVLRIYCDCRALAETRQAAEWPVLDEHAEPGHSRRKRRTV